MPSPNKQSLIETFSRNPNLASISGVNGQFGINIVDGSWWKYSVAASAWVQAGPPLVDGVSTYANTITDALDLLTPGPPPDQKNYLHGLFEANLRAVSIVVNGATLNSAAPIDVAIERLPAGGGAPVLVASVSLASGTADGEGVVVSIAPAVVVAVGDAIRARVTAVATVAGGLGAVTLFMSPTGS